MAVAKLAGIQGDVEDLLLRHGRDSSSRTVLSTTEAAELENMLKHLTQILLRLEQDATTPAVANHSPDIKFTRLRRNRSAA
jgi:hypothetical protein